MPDLKKEEIQKLIDDGKIRALSLDTSILKGKGYDFESPPLQTLRQFNNTDISVILSDIVVREMKQHITEEATKAQISIKKALRNYKRYWEIQNLDKIYEQIRNSFSPQQLADMRIKRFMSDNNIESIDIPGTKEFTSSLIDRYFDGEVPFNKEGKKKSEFPDAYALLSLEEWAQENKTMVLCVSADKDWNFFCSKSVHLFCVKELDTALSYFNHDPEDTRIADKILEIWEKKHAPQYTEEIFRAIEICLDDLNFDIDVSSDAHYTAFEVIEANLQFVDPINTSPPAIIASDAKSITFSITIEASIKFRAAFSFYVYDSVDKDFTNIGDKEQETEATLPFKVTIKTDRVINEIPIFHEISASRMEDKVVFGYIDHFSDEEPIY